MIVGGAKTHRGGRGPTVTTVAIRAPMLQHGVVVRADCDGLTGRPVMSPVVSAIRAFANVCAAEDCGGNPVHHPTNKVRSLRTCGVPHVAHLSDVGGNNFYFLYMEVCACLFELSLRVINSVGR
jgi:hypothetical protein